MRRGRRSGFNSSATNPQSIADPSAYTQSIADPHSIPYTYTYTSGDCIASNRRAKQ
ncbi:hypothetical protein M2341_001072 [Sphingobium sp. B7D2B]|uniref:hypothetical protein n=1 Tax=Sphingobium sp. B7D2B TaxID=2940583 RepID=UPI0022252C9E|nr:hypothetical protein [Sphingobium sp. B7D2B]MCW2365625.1 hypothetical protein [Sphingobium sp. B7D2B]